MLRVYFALIIIGGILTIWSILQIPAEAGNVALFGLSQMRILMVFGILAVLLGSAGMLLVSWVRKSFFVRFEQALTCKVQQKNFWGWSILFFSLNLFSSAYLIALIPEITEPFTRAYFVRLQPLISWWAVLCAQSLVTLPLLRYGFDLKALKPRSRIAYQIGGIFVLLLILWILVAQTRLGLTRSDAGAGWYDLGAPLLETQAFIAWMIALIYIGLALWSENRTGILARTRQLLSHRVDLILSILLWVAAFATWNSIPLTPNWFAAPGRPPNQAIYPNSDAYLYDTTGQTLLTGEGLKTLDAPFAIRPLYATFLAVLHGLGGFDYEPIIWMQVAVLALIPVVLYWVTLQIHNRVSALIAGVLLIFREANAIILGGSITTSHSKLIMADLPTMLGVLLLVLVIIRWLDNPAQRPRLALIAGGLSGAFMLIRPEFAVLLPFLGLAALLELRRFKQWFKGMLLIGFGTTLFLLPWIWRNYQITGTIFLDSPHYRSDLFALRYQEHNPDENGDRDSDPEGTSEIEIPATKVPSQTAEPTELTEFATTAAATPTPQIAYQPGENADDFAERMFSKALNYARNNLSSVLYFIANHFTNSQIQAILYLPATYRLPDSAVAFLGHKDPTKFWSACCAADSYIRRLPFWFKWDGSLPQQSIPPLILNVFLISVGIATAWKGRKFSGLTPLFASLGYTLINALVRNSGGRYILPVDWVGIFYFSIGLVQMTLWTLAYFRGSELPANLLGRLQPTTKNEGTPPQGKAIVGTAILILLVGSLLPIAEKIIPERYSPNLLAERQNQVLNSLDLPLESQLPEGISIIQGRALYPRYHTAGEGEAGIRRTPFSPLPFARVDFFMVGPYNGGVVLAQDAAPEQFTNGTDVLAIGCRGEAYFDALVIVLYDDKGKADKILLRKPYPEMVSCPLASP